MGPGAHKDTGAEAAPTAEFNEAVAALRELILAGAAYRIAVAAMRGIGVRETEVIGYLLVRGPQRANDLSAALKVSPGSITNLVDRLEAKELVIREPAPNDRRASLVVLTPNAVEFAQQSWSLLADCFAKVRGSTDADTVRILNGLARAVREQSDAVATAGAEGGSGVAGMTGING